MGWLNHRVQLVIRISLAHPPYVLYRDSWCFMNIKRCGQNSLHLGALNFKENRLQTERYSCNGILDKNFPVYISIIMNTWFRSNLVSKQRLKMAWFHVIRVATGSTWLKYGDDHSKLLRQYPEICYKLVNIYILYHYLPIYYGTLVVYIHTNIYIYIYIFRYNR